MRRRLAIVAPFLVLPLFARLAVGPIGDALASAAAHVAPASAPIVNEEPTDELDAPVERNSAGSEPPSRIARRAAAIASARRPDPTPAPTADAGPPAPRATIVVPAAVIAKAIEEKKVGARDAVDENGKPYGARIHGVGRYHTALQNGDVIIEVGGVRVTSASTLLEIGLKQIAAGAKRLTGKIQRGEATYDVVLELPKRD